MKSFFCAMLCLFVALSPIGAERINKQVTVTAGTPVRVALGTTKMNRLFLQSRHSNTGLIYVLMGVNPTKTCDATDATQLTAELGPGDSTHPGSSLSDPQGANGNSPSDYEDASWLCVDGTHTSDVVIISFWHRL